jgi:SpoVK/Ycf46/Vps4 family AAA+-type ATPase
MTSLAQVTALVDAHVNRDYLRFRAVTLQIAAHLASRSERGADQLRALVNQQATSFVPLPSATGLLSVPSKLASLDAMVLAPGVRDRLDRVVLEHERKNELLVLGLHPARKLLFTGVPGVGKTMAAGAIARAVGLPMFRVELHGVIQSHLGETSGKLAQVFEHVRTMPAVYLFDEFDALGADRSAVSDGTSASAEMRRVVNSLLQFIEDDRSDSMIIAATNYEQMLDRALFRRFDEVITFEIPSQDELTRLVLRALPDVPSLDFAAIYGAMSNPRLAHPDVLFNPKLGHADVCGILSRVRKDNVLLGTPIDTARIVEAIEAIVRIGMVAGS